MAGFDAAYATPFYPQFRGRGRVPTALVQAKKNLIVRRTSFAGLVTVAKFLRNS